MDIEVAVSVLMRAIHIFTGALLVGTALYSWLSDTPIARSLKGPILASCGFIIISGGYTLMTKAVTPPGYHLWFGIKLLFVMHILAVHFMMAIQDMSETKKLRLARGIALSGTVVIILSAILRWKSIGA